jgi:hypothetical protein
MARTATREDGSETAQLREALAISELQLREVRGELGRLVRITERDLARQRSEAEGAIANKEALKARIERNKNAVVALIKLIRDSDLLPPEIIISWLVRSDLFDPDFYLETNEDVATAQVDPGEHYVKHGLDEDRPFNETFTVCV